MAEEAPRFAYPLIARWGEPDLLDRATGIAAWFTDPPGVVTQLGERTYLDVGMVRYLIHSIHPKVRAKFPGKTYALHDWTSAVGFEFEARAPLLRFCVERRSDFLDTGIAHPPFTPVWNMALNVGKTVLEAGRFPFRLFPNLRAGIEQFGLRHASQG